MRARSSDLERRGDVGGRDAIDAPGGIGLDHAPGFLPGQRFLELAGGVDVELLKHLGAEDAGSFGAQVQENRFRDVVFRPASMSWA